MLLLLYINIFSCNTNRTLERKYVGTKIMYTRTGVQILIRNCYLTIKLIFPQCLLYTSILTRLLFIHQEFCRYIFFFLVRIWYPKEWRNVHHKQSKREIKQVGICRLNEILMFQDWKLHKFVHIYWSLHIHIKIALFIIYWSLHKHIANQIQDYS